MSRPGDVGNRLKELDERAAEERQRFSKALGLTAEKLRPASLAREVGNRALDLGLDTIESARNAVRKHPVKAIGAAAIVGAYFARRPLFRLAVKGVAAGKRKFGRKGADGNVPPQAGESEE